MPTGSIGKKKDTQGPQKAGRKSWVIIHKGSTKDIAAYSLPPG